MINMPNPSKRKTRRIYFMKGQGTEVDQYSDRLEAEGWEYLESIVVEDVICFIYVREE